MNSMFYFGISAVAPKGAVPACIVMGIAVIAMAVVIGIFLRRKTQPAKAEVAAAKGEQSEAIKAVSKKQTVTKVFVQIGLYTFLSVLAIAILFPFYFMLISSLKTLDEYNEPVPTLWPRQFVWDNYRFAFVSDLHLGSLFLNTVLVGVVSTLLSLVVTVLAAFAFARLEFRGKNLIFALLLATMMIPGELFTITNYITANTFGWAFSPGGTYTSAERFSAFLGLVIPFLVSVFYIYLLRQNFMQIPNELYLAAKVDGTSDLKYLWKVMIPLAAPTLISITILKMMGAWNSYIWPKLIAQDAFQLVTVGIRTFSFAEGTLTHYPRQMAAVVLVTIPLLLVFMFFRKYIMRGVSRSGIKG